MSRRLFTILILSGIMAFSNVKSSNSIPPIRWYETGANRRAARYFNRHFGTEWDDVENPRSKDIARSLILTR